MSLRESLHMEQQRYRQLRDERETTVACLHSQIRQLQHDHDDYYTKYQELQVSIQTLTFILVEFVSVSTPEQTVKLSLTQRDEILCEVINNVYFNVCFYQSEMQECQKRMDEMEAELQKANNKVCHTGHQLNQLTAKVKTQQSILQNYRSCHNP